MRDVRHVSLRVHGRVQGVGFRYSVLQKARELELSGYVKNMRDGTVLIEAEGEQGALDQLDFWCQQGPGWARVDRIEKEEGPTEGYSRFMVK